jgi:Glycosyltransferase family 87
VKAADDGDAGQQRIVTRLLTACLLSVGTANVLLGLLVAWTHDQFFDFGVFYDAVAAWSRGGNPYYVPNLNPPYVTLALAPLAWFPKRTAWLIWQAVNATACVQILRICRTEKRWTPLALALLATHASTAAQTQMGQVVWILGLPMTLAWRAWRRGEATKAGVWMGIVMAAKPFLLPCVLPALTDKRWRQTSLVALLVVVGIAGVAVLSLGPTVFEAWLAGRTSAWQSITQPLNASLASFTTTLGAPPLVGPLVGCLLLPVTIYRWPRLTPDLQWLAIVANVLLITPLGWIQYSGWLLPATWIAWTQLKRPLAHVALLLTLVPPFVIVLFDHARVIYPLGMVCWLGAAVFTDTRAGHLGPIDVTPRHVEDAT